MKRFSWLRRRKSQVRKLALEKCAENARHLGMDRRQFLASAMGMTTTLWVLGSVQGCSSNGSSGGIVKKPLGAPDGGGACIPPEAMFDEQCANAIIGDAGGKQFIFDIETHWFNKEDLQNWSAYQNAFGALFQEMTEEKYIDTFFCKSDTTMTALTTWPGVTCTPTRSVGCGSPLSNEHAYQSRDKINALAGNSRRVVSHVQILPQDPSGIDLQLEIMQEHYCEHGAAAWELHPGFEPGFTLNDPNGARVIERGLELGLKVFCVHKGLPIMNFFDPNVNYPDDIGPAAVKYPDARIIVYHSALFAGSDSASQAPPEGPFDPADPHPPGVNALIKSVLDAGLTPGPQMNVYGETGGYSSIMTDLTQSQHFFGKLMKYLGTDNVCWGTNGLVDPIQPQIEAFRALEIPPSMQEQFGYPPLGPSTPEGKTNQDKILGLNAARVYGVDAEARRCSISSCPTG